MLELSVCNGVYVCKIVILILLVCAVNAFFIIKECNKYFNFSLNNYSIIINIIIERCVRY